MEEKNNNEISCNNVNDMDILTNTLTTKLSLSETEIIHKEFSFPSVREVVNEARAKILLEEHVGIDGPLTKLKYAKLSLRNKSYTECGATIIAEDFLKNITFLKKADLADMIAGRPEEEALRVLHLICSSLEGHSLIEIDLSDNALGEKGIRACFGILQNQHHLESLYFCNNGISSAAAKVIANEVVLFRGNQIETKLKLFHFYNNMSGDDGAKALATIFPCTPNLQDLRFSATRSGPDGCLAFANGLLTLKNLKKLDLSDNTFDENGLILLKKVIENNIYLEYLNLRDAALLDVGLLYIMDGITSNKGSKLEYLDLSGNEITSKGLNKVKKYFSTISNTLKVFKLEENELGTNGAKILANIFDTYIFTKLESLVVNGNEITSSGARILIHSVIKNLKMIQILEINSNMISKECLNEIDMILGKNQKSQILGLMDDNDEDVDED